MRYLSLFSGIEAATVAWSQLEHNPLNPLDKKWQCVGVSEIEPFACKVLAHHYPNIPNLGDVTKIDQAKIDLLTENNKYPIDLVVGGSPCQAFSLAGLRKGLEDPRGNLTLEFLRVVSLTNPKYVLWENVPGVLADKTQAFNILITGLSELGYSVDHQILDAQEFGLPQKRSRVFLVCEKINACFSPHTAFETLNKILLLTLADMGKKYHNKTSVLKDITLSPLPQMLMLLNNALSSKLPTYQIELKNNMNLSKKDFFPIINQMVYLLFNEVNDIFIHERLISLLTMTFDYYQVKDIDTYSPTLEEVTPLWRFKHNLLTNFLENLTVFFNDVESREKSSLFQNLLNTDSLFYILKEETEIFNKRFSKRKLNVEKIKMKEKQFENKSYDSCNFIYSSDSNNNSC